jgi:multidrug transporter EmrE-like cation transporter
MPSRRAIILAEADEPRPAIPGRRKEYTLAADASVGVPLLRWRAHFSVSTRPIHTLTVVTPLGYRGADDFGGKGAAMLGVMILVNQVMNFGATTLFALSGGAPSVRRFILYQIFGGLFGLGINLTYAGLVRYSSVQVAAAIGIGLAFVTVQIVSSYFFFHAGFTAWQWIGVCLVFAGVLFIALGRA